MFLTVQYDNNGNWQRNWIAHENRQTLWETILEYYNQKGLAGSIAICDHHNFTIQFSSGNTSKVVIEKLLTLNEVFAVMEGK